MAAGNLRMIRDVPELYVCRNHFRQNEFLGRRANVSRLKYRVVPSLDLSKGELVDDQSGEAHRFKVPKLRVCHLRKEKRKITYIMHLRTSKRLRETYLMKRRGGLREFQGVEGDMEEWRMAQRALRLLDAEKAKQCEKIKWLQQENKKVTCLIKVLQDVLKVMQD